MIKLKDNILFKNLFSKVYYDFKLRNKLILAYSVFIIFPILILGLSSYYFLQKYMIEAEKNSIIQSMNQLNNTIDYFCETYISKSQMFFNNIELQNAIKSNVNNVADVVESQKKITGILNQLNSDFRYPEMKNSFYFGGNISIELYIMNDTLSSYGGTTLPFNDIKNEEWCKGLYKSNKLFSWQSGNEINGSSYISLNRRLLDFDTTKDIGVLRINIPVVRIKNIIQRNMHANAYSYLYLDNNFNSIFTLGDEAGTDSGIIEKIKTIKPDDIVNGIVINNKKLIVGCIDSDLTGWRLIYLTPLDPITSKTKTITIITIITIIISIVMCIFIATLISSFMTKRIDILVKKTNQIKEGNIAVNLVLRGNDEIGQLDKNFNSMIERINALIENDYKSKIFTNKTKLELLQEQINPHLLYNTLSMIGSIARKSDQTEVLDVANNLINFYKSILNKGKIISSLRSEIEMVKRYIDIMRFVYNLDIEVSIDIDEEILNYYSIKLFLQPIVENAIVHGIKPNKSGILFISGKENDNYLEFTVLDDGVGMEEDVKKYLNSVLNNNEEDKGYGLSNVIKRINLFFGDEYGVEIKSNYGEGTSITVKIPKFTEGKIKKIFENKYLL